MTVFPLVLSEFMARVIKKGVASEWGEHVLNKNKKPLRIAVVFLFIRRRFTARGR